MYTHLWLKQWLVMVVTKPGLTYGWKTV